MNGKLYIMLVSLISLSLFSAFAIAMDYGTAEEAKAMLAKAVKAVQKDKETALKNFNQGNKGFKQKDLYVFCLILKLGKFVQMVPTIRLSGKMLKP